MIELLYRSSLFNILILETWCYVALGLRLSVVNFSGLSAVLIVLLYPRLKSLAVEILLGCACPVLFYLNSGDGWLQTVPVIYFMLLFAILKYSPPDPDSSPDSSDDREISAPFAPVPAYADQTLTLSHQTAAPRPQVLSFGPRPGLDQPMSTPYTTTAMTPPAPVQKKQLEWTINPLIILCLGLGLVLGWLWDPAPKTSLSLEPETSKPYFSYIQPSRMLLENKAALLKERELDTYLEPVDPPLSPYFRLLTFSPLPDTAPKLPRITAPPKLLRMYDQLSKLLPRTI